jgi:GT2 family glycosyltransferase
MSGKYKIDPTKFTAIMTSCGRFDLLEDTLHSFLTYFEIQKIIVAEDSGLTDQAMALARKFPNVEMCVNSPRLGQAGSIDKAYGRVATPFIIHLEDDWHFGGWCDFNKLADYLVAHNDLSGIWIAHREFAPRYERRASYGQFDGIHYRSFPLDAHPEWFSYSFTPALIRTQFWKTHGPYDRYKTEGDLSLALKNKGFRVAQFMPSLAYHTGVNRSLWRKKSFTTKLMRSITKRVRRLNDHLVGPAK